MQCPSEHKTVVVHYKRHTRFAISPNTSLFGTRSSEFAPPYKRLLSGCRQTSLCKCVLLVKPSLFAEVYLFIVFLKNAVCERVVRATCTFFKANDGTKQEARQEY